MADEQTCKALGIREQEYEQLQTTLETAETEIEILVQENRRLQKERADALDENVRLRHQMAQSHARLLETQTAAVKSSTRAICGLESELSILNEELQISLEELQTTADELEKANSALMQANETLEQQVAERTRHLEEALAERDELLRCKDDLMYEIGHRVRDSLDVVMSLIQIQTLRSEEPLVRQALQTTGARIHAVAQVHDRLFTGDGSGRVRMDRYLEGICQQIARAHGVRGSRQTLEVEAEPVELSADLAFPLGLIVTELASNALQHAFDSPGTGTVWVQFGRQSTEHLKLLVADDGKGIHQGVEFAPKVGLGMQIVALMVQRLNASLSVAQVHGTCFTLKIPERGIRQPAGERS
jgi:two-component sensor histidine kinase